MDEPKKRMVLRQHSAVGTFLQGNFAETIPIPFVVLNDDREIVFANSHALRFFDKEQQEDLLGFRPGEAVYCVHAMANGSCGISASCEHCGTVKAVLGAKVASGTTEDSRVLTNGHGTLNALNLRVDASRINMGDEEFTVVYLQDISKEKDREILEQFFLHDTLNGLGGIKGAASLICQSAEGVEYELAHAVMERASQLVRDVQFLQLFFAAEQNVLVLDPKMISALSLLNEVRMLSSTFSCANDKVVVVDDVADVEIVADKGLLQRSLENLTKNALEASNKGDVVTLGYMLSPGFIYFYIKNRSFIPRHIQLQLFQRTFSTKGRGRGIGTYSARLFVTNFLKGSVSFETTVEEGTTFFVQIPMN